MRAAKAETPMEIATRQGFVVVAARRDAIWRSGVWAVHESLNTAANEYTVTHVPSGHAAVHRDSYDAALTIAKALAAECPRAGERCPFGGMPSPRTLKRIETVVRAVINQFPVRA